MGPRLAFWAIVIIGYVVILWYSIAFLRSNHRRPYLKPLLIGAITWAVHGLIFYIVLIVRYWSGLVVSGDFWGSWSAGLRAHEVVTVGITLAFLYSVMKGRKNG